MRTAAIPALLSFLASVAMAQAPDSMAIQGSMTNQGGAVVDGTYAVTVALYASDNAVAPEWTETQAIPVTDGVFSLILGDTIALSAAVVGASSHVGLTVENEPELPRTPLHSVAFAYWARTAQTALGISCSGCVPLTALAEGVALASDVPTHQALTDAIAAAIEPLASTEDVTSVVAAAIEPLASTEDVTSAIAAAIEPLATTEDVTSVVAAAIEPLATTEDVTSAVAAIPPATSVVSLVQSTVSAFQAGTLTNLELSGAGVRPLVALAGLNGGTEVGDGSDGILNVPSGVHVDDGSPKQYVSVFIASGATVKVIPWNGGLGGTIDWKVQTTATIQGSVDVTGAGFRGGVKVQVDVCSTGANGNDGESQSGLGNQSTDANGGGGGAGVLGSSAGSAGGGGGYGAPGEPGFYAGNNVAGAGGQVYGDAQLTTLHLGSGGGVGGMDANSCGPKRTGPGGDGGGAVRIVATELNVSGSIVANGADATPSDCLIGSCGSADDGGSGGGSGGSIHLRASTLSIAGAVGAAGGLGANGHHDSTNTGGQAPNYRGGHGGVGRIRVDAVVQDVAGTVVPAPGFAETPPETAFTTAYSEGVFVSAVLDAGGPVEWESIHWQAHGGPRVEVQVRTGEQADLSDAPSFSGAPVVANGQDLSAASTVSDGHRYAQYRVTLLREADSAPTLSAMVLNTRAAK